MDLATLRRSVGNDIENCRYNASPNTIGTALSEDAVEAELAAMRAALVSPYWADAGIRDTHEQIATNPAVSRKCAVIADDLKGTVLAFDPIEKEFLLAMWQKDALLTIGVRGHAIGRFCGALAKSRPGRSELAFGPMSGFCLLATQYRLGQS